MSSIDQLQNLLPSPHMTVTGEDGGDFIVVVDGHQFHLSKAECEEYLQRMVSVVIGPETAVFYPGHYEHLVDVLDKNSVWRLSRMENTSLANQDGSLSVEVSRPSTRVGQNITRGSRLAKNDTKHKRGGFGRCDLRLSRFRGDCGPHSTCERQAQGRRQAITG